MKIIYLQCLLAITLGTVAACTALPNIALAQDADSPLPPLPRLYYPESAGKIAALQRKLDSIVIAKVSFQNEDIAQVVAFLQEKSRALDPRQGGVSFALFAPKSSTYIHREVSLTAKHQNLKKILDQIGRQTHLNYTVDESAVYLYPAPDPADDVFGDRTYFRGRDFFPMAANPAAPSPIEVKAQLIACGIRFPEGATAVYFPESHKLVVHNTRLNLDLIDEMVNADK